MQQPETPSVATLYPKYYKNVSHLEAIDVYRVHQLFNIQDPSGAIQHASKKLLLSGVRTGGKSQFDDIREARDTLNRWLEMNKKQIMNTPTLPIEPVYTIYIEIAGGCVHGIRGDRLPTDCQINFVIRDQDDIEQGAEDQQPPGYEPEVYYY